MHPKGFQEQGRQNAGKPENLARALGPLDKVRVVTNTFGDHEVYIYGQFHAKFSADTDPREVEARALDALDSIVNGAVARAEPIVGIKEAADMLRITRNAFDQRRHAGQIPVPDATVSGRPAWSRSTIEEYVRSMPWQRVGGGRKKTFIVDDRSVIVFIDWHTWEKATQTTVIPQTDARLDQAALAALAADPNSDAVAIGFEHFQH